MEQTYEKLMRRNLRRYYGVTGWILVIYYLIMNAAVLFDQFFEIAVSMIHRAFTQDIAGIADSILEAQESAWGYFLAAAAGILILLLWKKPKFWKEQIWAKGKPMTFGAFFGLLSVFLSVQALYEIYSIGLESGLNAFGYSVFEGFNELSGDMNDFGMFLYGGILAPVTEEILFRGLIQRRLLPYGKRFAILGSAFTFGMFHGNILQTPYAFLCGLVLGYVASEYSIAWSMLLHMINNMVIADGLSRMTSFLPTDLSDVITLVIIGAFTIAAIIVLIVRRNEVRDYFCREELNPVCIHCFFSSVGIIVFTVLMAVSIVFTFFVMLTPI